MIWIGLATLVVVFVVGFRVLTSDSRRAIRRLSERLGITPVPLESMIDQLGKTAGNEYLRYLERPNEAHLQNAAQVLLIWQVAIVDASEKNLHYWYRLMQKARLAAPITEAQIRLAQGFLRELDPDMSDLHNLQQRYNDLFLPEDGVHWLHWGSSLFVPDGGCALSGLRFPHSSLAGRISVSAIRQDNYSRIFRPCFCTTLSNFNDIPLGRLAPVSHFCTVDTLVFR